MSKYRGLLLIGDPHLEGRQPGFRKDDYPQVVLDKLAWCLAYARRNSLLPAILGDLFDKPRDNPTWMVGRLLELIQGEVLAIYGNHDCADPQLSDNDTLSLLVKAGRLRLVSEEAPWRGRLNGRPAVVGGSSYRCRIPFAFEIAQEEGSVDSRAKESLGLFESLERMEASVPCPVPLLASRDEASPAPPDGRADDSAKVAGTLRVPSAEASVDPRSADGTRSVPAALSRPSSSGTSACQGPKPFVVWLAHHDLIVPGNEEEGRFRPFEVPGVDLVINGHIHRRSEDVRAGGTLWITPGNISRRKRCDATRTHVPSVLRIDVTATGFEQSYVTVPHRAFDDVFHEMVIEEEATAGASAFVTGLAELQARRTQTGAGLMEFLQRNLAAAEPAVAQEILDLAREVTTNAQTAG